MGGKQSLFYIVDITDKFYPLLFVVRLTLDIKEHPYKIKDKADAFKGRKIIEKLFDGVCSCEGYASGTESASVQLLTEIGS